jgi:hypothetical protein
VDETPADRTERRLLLLRDRVAREHAEHLLEGTGLGLGENAAGVDRRARVSRYPPINP